MAVKQVPTDNMEHCVHTHVTSNLHSTFTFNFSSGYGPHQLLRKISVCCCCCWASSAQWIYHSFFTGKSCLLQEKENPDETVKPKPKQAKRGLKAPLIQRELQRQLCI